ncbi:PaaI family thioesterase [Sphingopyxis granuli]|uniref:PaaI family thioesterase n=1 Tax=Sphingopyxis TaxID=165697 RepID=UPI00086E8256|nr:MULTISPECIES: PaaI family thioesterase [Sphingopyxis]APW72765.1 phenylacetic acid degradation protein [Sphingopyxis granuli]AVA13730.1 PaaI family thioesterase [Sphingopyxis sp. MG]ODU27500.1 MAG: phenylacetic acid degradation protein [Sphingopyxis sp. SCN 67-31]UNK78451.1 PaaI family thioesterase [Sphingopyxis granuli]
MDFAAAMPLAGTLGVTIHEGTKDRVAGKLPVRPEICTAGHIVHGGAIMAFADCLGAVGAFLTLPEGASGTTTIESKTNFLGAGPEGSVLIGEATPVRIGKRLSVWQTRIRTEDGADVALVTQTQMVLWPA